MNGHAQAALEGKEGSERAVADFEAGITQNPFSRSDGWQWTAWQRRTTLLTHRRDCDRFKCCQEHDVHLAGHGSRYYMGLGSCQFCEVEVDAQRAERIEASMHDGRDDG